MKTSRTIVNHIVTNNTQYISGAVHTIEYEPIYFSHHFRLLKEDSSYINKNLIDIKREAALKIAEEIIDIMDVRKDMNSLYNSIDYIFTIRALDDKKTRDFENKINELERNLSSVQLDNNSLKLSNEELIKDNKIMKDKIEIIENGNFWTRLKFVFGVKN